MGREGREGITKGGKDGEGVSEGGRGRDGGRVGWMEGGGREGVSECERERVCERERGREGG